MSIFDIFKKKKKEEKKEGKEEKKLKEEEKIKEEKPKKEEKKKEEKKEVEEKVEKLAAEKPRRRREVKIAPLVLLSPHIAEKPTRLAEINQYVFKVYPSSCKTEIKKAVEEIYGVDVLKVRIIKIPRKKRRLGKTRGWRKGYKKAIVKIKEGQKIEMLPR